MSDELEKARKRGAEVKAIPRLVDVNGLADITEQLNGLVKQISQAHESQNATLVSAVEKLIATIEGKKMSMNMTSEKFDMTELVKAVQSLRKEVIQTPIPLEWRIDFERDQRSLMKSGIMLTGIQRKLDS